MHDWKTTHLFQLHGSPKCATCDDWLKNLEIPRHVNSLAGRLSDEKKSKIINEFNNQNFQVLCATESYKIGVHNPYVSFVARVGCKCNMNVFLQEIGRSGRSKEKTGLRVVIINEHKDDQQLGYWLKGCRE